MATREIGKTKKYCIYELEDKNTRTGKMWKADGPAITKALKDGRIKQNDIWHNESEVDLVKHLKDKGV